MRATLAITLLVAGCSTARGHSPPAPLPEPPAADGFDFPVGAPDGQGYYDAQPYGENAHLGADWNGVGGAASDLGDPVFAIADGVVTWAGPGGEGWGPVVRVVHRHQGRSVESIYAHLDRVDAHAGQIVRRGERIGTIGTGDGAWLPHLHFEIRTAAGLPLGGGYGTNLRGFVDPTAFIHSHRPPDADTAERAPAG